MDDAIDISLRAASPALPSIGPAVLELRMLLLFQRERMLLLESCCGRILMSHDILIFYFLIRMPRYLSVLLDWLLISLTTFVYLLDRLMLTLHFY